MTNRFFINRRTGNDRREGSEKRKNPRLDLSHKRRRQFTDRRQLNRSLLEDFHATSTRINQKPQANKY